MGRDGMGWIRIGDVEFDVDVTLYQGVLFFSVLFCSVPLFARGRK